VYGVDNKGIVGFTGAFRENVAGIPEGSKVVFTGSVAVCTPFIELLSYSIRDKGFNMVYVPNADTNEARKIKKQENIGISVVDEMADPEDPAVVVVLGGLAMPKFGCPPEDVVDMIHKISEETPESLVSVSWASSKRVDGIKKYTLTP
jgi:hypothetical protein